jgi:hypothetical protein
MKKLWLAAVGALLLVCLSVGVASAQGEELGTVPFCGELSERDCAALAASSGAMAGLTSGSSVNDIEVSFTGGAPNHAGFWLRFSMDNTFVMEPETLARMEEIKTMMPEELEADTAALTEALLLPLAIDHARAVTLTFSPELGELLSGRLNRNIPSEISFNVRTINNVLYVRLADLEVFGLDPQRWPEWLGVDLMAFMPRSIARTTADPDFSAAEAQAALTPPGARLTNSVVYYIPPEQAAWYADFIQLVSLGAGAVDGQPANRIYLSWDIPRYLGGPLFAQRRGALDESGHPSASSLTLGMVSNTLLDGLRATAIQTVGAGVPYLYDVSTEAEWAFGIPGGQLLADRPTLAIKVTTANRNLNAVEAIPVPDEALELPVNFIMQMIGLMQR